MSAKDRISLERDYAESIGRAIYVWLAAEWMAINVINRLRPGTIHDLSKHPAGEAARVLVSCASEAPKELKAELLPIAEEFRTLAGYRNAIAHGRPCTSPDGDQRLSTGTRRKRILSQTEIDEYADQFAQCDILLTNFFHEKLDEPN